MGSNNGKTLGLVVRVSRVGGRDGERFQSPGDQIAIGTARAEREGYGVRVFEEAGDVSGATPYADRPAMSEALGLVDDGQLDGIVVAAMDRLVREDELEDGSVVTLKQVQRRIRKAGGVLLIGDNAAAEILDPEDDELEGTEEWAVEAQNLNNRLFRREMKKRWRRARENAIARGAYVGQTPAGYLRDDDGRLQLGGPFEAAVRSAFTLRASGSSWSTVAAHLTAAGVPTSRGSTIWSLKATSKLLQNEAYLGVAKSGPYRNESAHLPLVDESTWRRVQAKRETRGSTVKQARSALHGVVRCESCGHAMSRTFTTRDGRRFDFYTCGNAGVCEARPSIGANLLEAHVFEAIAEHLTASDVSVKRPDTVALEGDVEAATIELEGYVENTSVTDLGPELYKRGLEKRKAALAEAQAALDAAAPAADFQLPTDLAGIAAWDVKAQRAAVAASVASITVAKGRGLDRVTLTLR